MFKRESRNIYTYFDGVNTVAADPAELAQRLSFCYPKGSTYEVDAKALAVAVGSDNGEVTRALSEERYNAFKRFAEYARSVLTLKPIQVNEAGEVIEGVTDSEALVTLVHFMDWLTAVKKNTASLPKSPTSTEVTS